MLSKKVKIPIPEVVRLFRQTARLEEESGVGIRLPG